MVKIKINFLITKYQLPILTVEYKLLLKNIRIFSRLLNKNAIISAVIIRTI